MRANVFYPQQYDVHNPPPKPAEGNWTRFVCISDTHEHEFDVPLGDVLLHGGDLTHVGREEGCRSVLRWLASLPHPHKMCVPIVSALGVTGLIT